MYYQPHNIKHGKEFLQPSIDFDDNKRTSYLNYTYRLRNIRTRSSSIYTEQVSKIRMSNTFVTDPSKCAEHTFLVYSCDYSRSCGGMGDRQRGIVSSFILALITARVFIIDFEKPCELDNFLKPTVYDWTICKRFIKNEKNALTIDMMNKSSMGIDMNNLRFNLWHWKVVFVKINSNLIYQLRKIKDIRTNYGWLLNMSIPSAYNMILNLLFQPKDTLMSFLDNLIDQNVKEKYLVCCHIRVGKNPSIPQDNAFGEFEKPNETIVFKYLKRYTDPDKYVIYLASDSLYVRSEFWKIFKNGIHIDVPIIHVDRLGTHKHNEKEACDGLKYVLIEQYLLSTCDILILTADSGFGKYAAYLRGSSDNLFLIQLNDSQVITTKLRYI
ncbi:uncharacterized protein LOC132730747 isoform X2 [Ruditapes philippinarum]|nr:uncharacterized protein LOC132730747 isoform X2 [Ruditapes philippinarum]